MFIVKYEVKLEEKECPICKNKYIINSSIKRERERKTCGNRSCSAKLGNLSANKVKVNCKVCDKEFLITHFNVQESGNYCSNACRKRAYELKCIICDTAFRSSRDYRKYCSPQCTKIGNKTKTRKITCFCCGIEFERPTFTLPSDKRWFCSKKCAQRQFARENPNRYGSTWGKIRDKKVKQDKHTCQMCKKQTFEPYGLHVHHIIPVEKFENVDDAHFYENLITLCFECHMDLHDREVLG